MQVKWQVEIDPFCRAVLAKHWPAVRRYEDVRTVGAELERVDVICGGFPCQDISLAGDGAGLDGARSGLWFEMVRLVRELRPRFVIVENVAGLLDRGLGTVLGGLAESGYDAEWACFPTGRNMGHERERVFVVAHAVREGLPERGDADQVRVDAPFIFSGKRFASFVEAIDPRQEWANRPLLGRGIHGISKRVDRVRSLGNAVNPQVIEAIGRRILEAEGLA